jgi:hypothetical protein
VDADRDHAPAIADQRGEGMQLGRDLVRDGDEVVRRRAPPGATSRR